MVFSQFVGGGIPMAKVATAILATRNQKLSFVSQGI